MPSNIEKKEAEKFSILPLFIIAFLVQADHLIMVPLTVSIAADTGISLTHTGLLISIYPIAAALSAFIFAPFSDRVGRKKMLVFLITGFCLSSVGCALANTAESIFLFRILSGVFGGIIIPNALAFVSDMLDGKNKIRAITTLTLSFPIASVLGVPLGAWVSELSTWRAPFLVIAALGLISGLFILRYKNIAGCQDKNIIKQYLELLLLWKDRKIRGIFTIQFLMLIGLFAFVPQIGAWLSLNFQMSTTEIGICYMQGGVGAILGNFIARRLLQHNYTESLIVFGSLITAFTLLLLTMEVLNPQLVGLGFALTMFGGSIRVPALQTILSNLSSVNLRGRLLSMNMIVANVAMGLGGLWSLPFLSIESGLLTGMEHIGWVSFVTLCFIPLVIYRTRKQGRAKLLTL
mgnify:CR=1 FL=1